jgi:anionic cell wall polymer biosynthesis LytR-Cps2A-Psr (LCP) family protein
MDNIVNKNKTGKKKINHAEGKGFPDEGDGKCHLQVSEHEHISGSGSRSGPNCALFFRDGVN